jgi:hypothetical protein
MKSSNSLVSSGLFEPSKGSSSKISYLIIAALFVPILKTFILCQEDKTEDQNTSRVRGSIYTKNEKTLYCGLDSLLKSTQTNRSLDVTNYLASGADSYTFNQSNGFKTVVFVRLGAEIDESPSNDHFDLRADVSILDSVFRSRVIGWLLRCVVQTSEDGKSALVYNSDKAPISYEEMRSKDWDSRLVASAKGSIMPDELNRTFEKSFLRGFSFF